VPCANTACAGYRLLDGAAAYGNEVEVGDAIAEALRTGIVKRDELVRKMRALCKHLPTSNCYPLSGNDRTASASHSASLLRASLACWLTAFVLVPQLPLCACSNARDTHNAHGLSRRVTSLSAGQKTFPLARTVKRGCCCLPLYRPASGDALFHESTPQLRMWQCMYRSCKRQMCLCIPTAPINALCVCLSVAARGGNYDVPRQFI
jgi:hypothetical protein